MNLRVRTKETRTRPISENLLRCMSPEQRKKYGQLTSREAQEKWQRDTERQIHVEVSRECLRQKISVVEPAMTRRSTIAKGHPDMTLLKDNHCLLLELKADGGRLSTEQIDRIADLKECGNDTIVAYSSKEAIEAIHSWLSRIGACGHNFGP